MTSQLDGSLDLSGRTALVTGAASGIGLACARRLASAGADVVVADIKAEAAEDAAKEIGESAPARVIARAADLADLDAADALAREYAPDILINNAGIQHVAPLEEFPPEVFSQILRVMVEAPFRLVRASLPAMYERGWGRVVNISSAHGLRASPYKSAYVTAKHALEGLSKVIALEGAEHGVTSNCVCPSYVRTPLVEGQIEDQARAHGMSPAQVTSEVLLAKTAMKRLIEPEEVAELVAYMCGWSAGMMTGASVSLDGGWTAH
jgi:3-hydroxybutyrate dehydrogenase